MGVKVFVRFRPQSTKESSEGGKLNLTRLSENSFTVKDEKEEDTQFTFDRVFYSDCTQSGVYDVIGRPVVEDALQFRNGSVICYGQTGAGKTHTMEGEGLLSECEELSGVVPRVAKAILEGAKRLSSHGLVVRLSMVEVYMERIRDLFEPTKDNLPLMDDPVEGTIIVGVTEIEVKDFQEMMHLLKAALKNRAVGETKMNAESSRSHCVYTLSISSASSEESPLMGKVHLVDLAGSEKVDKTGAFGQLLNEAKSINKSLSALGKVINALTTDESSHIPFRDSKLTRILQTSMSGHSRTSLVCCCSPSTVNAAETLSTIRFGVRAKQIRNVPIQPVPMKLDYRKLWHDSEAKCARLLERLQEREAKQSSIMSGPMTDVAVGGKCSMGVIYKCINEAWGAEAKEFPHFGDVESLRQHLDLELLDILGPVDNAFGDEISELQDSCIKLLQKNTSLMKLLHDQP